MYSCSQCSLASYASISVWKARAAQSALCPREVTPRHTRTSHTLGREIVVDVVVNLRRAAEDSGTQTFDIVRQCVP